VGVMRLDHTEKTCAMIDDFPHRLEFEELV
jgi:hypothetical protein